MSFYNSNVFEVYGKILSPTLDFNSGVISKAPIMCSSDHFALITKLANKCVSLSKPDWDSYETSWDFKRNPLV